MMPVVAGAQRETRRRILTLLILLAAGRRRRPGCSAMPKLIYGLFFAMVVAAALMVAFALGDALTATKPRRNRPPASVLLSIPLSLHSVDDDDHHPGRVDVGPVDAGDTATRLGRVFRDECRR